MSRCVVDRTACVDLPAFPLQLLLKRRPGWRDHPVAVVDSDKPQGLVWLRQPLGCLQPAEVRRRTRLAVLLSRGIRSVAS